MTEILPPRIMHNEKLANDFFKANGIVSSYPSVHEQLESVIINRHALKQNGYNPSIIRHAGRLLMTYRWHFNNTAQTELAIAELNEKFEIKNTNAIRIESDGQSIEDGRLFIYKNQLHISFVESSWPKMLKCAVKWGLLTESPNWRVVNIQHPTIGQNDGQHSEKNWIFFQYEDDLMCLHQSWPEQIIYNLTKDNAEHRSPGVRWPYGDIHGDCLMPYQGKLVRFFHSRLNNEIPPISWRYYVGCCLMNSRPPFNTLSVSVSPLIYGSEICDLSETNRNNVSHYKSNVVFPCGCLEVADGWWLTVGTNDSGCCLVKIRHEDLKL